MDPEGMRPAAQRRTIVVGMAAAVPIAIALWRATFRFLPPGVVERGAADPVRFALGWTAVAVLLCLVAGVEAVAHRRLFTAAIDPLAGADPPAMKIDQRYLQQTLEQLVVFAAGLFGLAAFAAPDTAARAIAATAIVWILSRWAFWIGYRRASRFRAPGLVGMVQGILVLLWVVWRFGASLAGPIGGAVPVLLFVAIELLLIVQAKG
jgi:hypothetical protein